MIEKIKKVIMVSRPVSWVNTAYPFAAAYLLAGGSDYTLLAVATLFFLIPYNLMMYGINDIFDYESDIRNPRKGGIEGMREQKELHPIIAKSVVATSLPFVIYLIVVGSVLANIVLMGVLFFVVAYSLGGLRFKERPFLDSITSSIHFVGPAVYGLSLTAFAPEAWPYIAAFFAWGMASHAFGAIQDIIPDREGGIVSVATVLGARRTVYFAFACYLAASAILFVQPIPYSVIGVLGLVYIANIARLFTISDKTSGCANKAWRRFIWLNLFSGFIITMVLLITHVPFGP